MNAKQDLFTIVEQFLPQQQLLDIAIYGNGYINDTYLLSLQTPKAKKRYILQRINQHVFVQPHRVADNMHAMLEHIAAKPADQVEMVFPALSQTQVGKNSHLDNEGETWRLMSFIEQTRSIENLQTEQQAEQLGWALGHFHSLVADLPLTTMHDTLPEFHITPAYLAQYHKIAGQHTKTATTDSRYCEQIISTNAGQADRLELAKQSGELSLHVIHGDPKLNNFLFASKTDRIISLIDLDTVKPGLLHYDIADCLRSSCFNKTKRLQFDLDICSIVLENYIAAVKNLLSNHDFDLLYSAIELLPYELGLRFYSDYLQGNVYFKVTDEQQNLFRAIEQFQLMQSIQQQAQPLKRLIKQLQATYQCKP